MPHSNDDNENSSLLEVQPPEVDRGEIINFCIFMKKIVPVVTLLIKGIMLNNFNRGSKDSEILP